MIREFLKWLDPRSDEPDQVTNIKPITDQPALDRALQAPLAVVYKHSPFCGVSSWARREVERFATEHPDVQVFQIDVIQSRDVSDAIEELFGVRHQSPQAFLVRRGTPAWTGSHRSISANTLERELGPVHESG